MKNISRISYANISSLCILFALSACGGGGSTSAPSVQPVLSKDYVAYHFSAPVFQSTSGKMNDLGAGVSSAILPKGSFTYDASGQYSWGGGLSGGIVIYPSSENPRLPFAAMLCESMNQIDKKGTYVLIGTDATRVTNPIELAGQRFVNVSNCAESRKPELINFDAQGNLLNTIFLNTDDQIGTILKYSLADFAQMQTGEGLNLTTYSMRLHAYKRVVAGQTQFILVEQTKSLRAGGSDYIDIWK